MANNFEEGQGSIEMSTGRSHDNIASPKRDLQTAATELWTTAEFLDAEPYPIPIISGEEHKEINTADVEAFQGLTGAGNFEAGGLPVATESDETEPTATKGGYDYPGPFTRHKVLCMVYPYVTVGKLFFKQNGGSYVASAASIGNYAIWTAGHCVHAGNNRADGWSTNMVFVPAYNAGNAPYGQWPVSYLMCKTAWYQGGNPNGLYADMGGGVLFPDKAGKKISEIVGWLGFSWNWSRFQHWHAIGYPAASPFDGQSMIETEASYAYDGSVSGSPKPVGIGCDMTGGCSGGPWVMGFGTGNWVNGNNSYRNTSRPQEMCSPYFDNSAKSLFDDLVKGKP